MSYLTKAQYRALIDIDPSELANLPVQDRLALAYQHIDAKARKSEAFWNAVQGFAMGAIPVISFFGLQKILK